VRIAIVNDSLIAVEAMRRVVETMPQHRIAWLARDGAEAVAACERDRPDLILMDLIMPRVDGVEATRRIMEETPCAILVVTASVNGRAGKVFEALGAGAIDAVATPTLGSPSGANALLSKLEMVHRLVGEAHNHRKKIPLKGPEGANNRLVVIGASAGGPAAIATILASLPHDFPAPIVIVQHVDAQFASGMASWLNAQSPLPVRIACEGDRPQPGEVLLAGRDEHLVFTNSGTLGYKTEPSDCSSRPSVDVFFKSVIGHWKGEVTAVLLTGMGRDGAKGLKALRNDGAFTIAQDRATSVVYGMPKAAADIGAVAEILSLSEISSRIVTVVSGLTPEQPASCGREACGPAITW